MRLLISTILSVILGGLSAQAQESDYAVAIDSTSAGNKPWSPTGVRIGIDLLTPILGAFTTTRNNFEMMADVDFNNYFLVAEAGFGGADEVGETSSYSSQGTYYRIGPDVNFFARDKGLNVFFFGLRFAQSFYNETLTGIYDDDRWGAINKDLDQGTSTSSWAEMNTGLKVRVWKQVFIGYSFRFKFVRFASTDDPQFASYFIPGYGLAARNNNWSFNYYVFYRFNWKKKPIRWKN